MLHTASGGGSGYYIYHTQSLPAKSTFIHSDKIVVDDTDEIWVKAGGSADIDVVVTGALKFRKTHVQILAWA